MQIIVDTIIVLASLYSLIACGFVLIYRTSHVVNLAQGELMAMGGYFLFTVAMSLFKDPVPSLHYSLHLQHGSEIHRLFLSHACHGGRVNREYDGYS